MTSFNPSRRQLIDTHKEVGTVTEVFRLNHLRDFESLRKEFAGNAAIGHVGYATCGKDDNSYAQPFERHHIEKAKWFSFVFNGQLANFAQLRDEILSEHDLHLARETNMELIMHLLSWEFSAKKRPEIIDVLRRLSARLDGPYNIVFLNGLGDMFVARDPLGIRPLCYAVDGSLFATASENAALATLGFPESSIKSLRPGSAAIIEDGQLSIRKFANE